MVLKIIRWLRGYIVFEMSGRFPERFLNLINRRGIRHWDFIPAENGYTGRMFLSDYMKIRPTARNASVRLRSVGRVGLPFFIKKYKRRKGLFFGAVLAVIILCVMSLFVWDINVAGAEGLSRTELYDAFESCGFRVGMLKSQLNAEAVERQVELKLPEVRWLSVNALNNVATVEIKQQSKRPEMTKRAYPCNIKASDDGVITDITVSSGTCEVKRGYAVAKNQLLVNSVEAIGVDKQRYVHSEAVVMADVKAESTLELPKNRKNIILTENYTEKSNLRFLFMDLPFELSPSYDGAETGNYNTEMLRINNVTLPLGRTVRHCRYFETKKQKPTAEHAEKILRTRMALRECFLESGSTVKKRSIKLIDTENNYILSVSYVMNKDIAKKQKLSIE